MVDTTESNSEYLSHRRVKLSGDIENVQLTLRGVKDKNKPATQRKKKSYDTINLLAVHEQTQKSIQVVFLTRSAGNCYDMKYSEILELCITHV
jgi:hypothetical protein